MRSNQHMRNADLDANPVSVPESAKHSVGQVYQPWLVARLRIREAATVNGLVMRKTNIMIVR
jgi:hypothetical protein